MSGCRSIRSWLHRDAATLDEADRLVLEEHLQSCGSCREQRELLIRVRDVVRALPLDPIGPRGHQRAIARAILEGAPPQVVPRSTWQFALAGVFACALIAIALVWRAGDDDEPEVAVVIAPDARTPSPPAPPRPAASVASGSLTRDGVSLRAGSAVPTDVELHAADGANLEFRGARVMLAASTTIRWEDGRRAILLRDGNLDLDVDPAARTPISVVTDRFAVEVVGTAFRVTPHGVSVVRGAVRILGLDGSVIVTRLSAGERWDVDARPAPPVIPARTHLTRARSAFAVGDCRLAEQHADAALDAGPARIEIAEARTILAECAQATGRLDEAIRRYDAIVARFTDLPAAETALIATARLEVKRGRPREARIRYERYLARYPAGRFAADARRYLDR